VAGEGAAGFAGNVIVGGLIGMAVDASSGAMPSGRGELWCDKALAHDRDNLSQKANIRRIGDMECETESSHQL
jgi:hypothetical protein